MATITETISDPSTRAQMVQAVCALVDTEVGAKKGLSGMAIKAGYKVVQGAKPGFVSEVVDRLLPEFADALEPIVAEATASSSTVGSFFSQHADRVANALLSITDARAARVDNAAVKGAYNKLRGSAEANVASAAPGLGAIVEQFIG